MPFLTTPAFLPYQRETRLRYLRGHSPRISTELISGGKPRPRPVPGESELLDGAVEAADGFFAMLTLQPADGEMGAGDVLVVIDKERV